MKELLDIAAQGLILVTVARLGIEMWSVTFRLVPAAADRARRGARRGPGPGR